MCGCVLHLHLIKKPAHPPHSILGCWVRLHPPRLLLLLLTLTTPLAHRQALLKGEEARSSLQDAVAVVEFLFTFAPQCGTRSMPLGELQHAVMWPLDAPALPQLYLCLLRCLLQDQVGPVVAAGSSW